MRFDLEYVLELALAAFVVGTVFYMFYAIFRLFVARRERLMIIERLGMHPDSVRPVRRERGFGWLRAVAVVIGCGLGFFAGDLVGVDAEEGQTMAVAVLLIVLGVAMGGEYFLERALIRRDGGNGREAN